MSPDLPNTLTYWAQKLGVSVERIWPQLVAQVKLDAWIAIITCSILGTIAGILGWGFHKRASQLITDYDDGAVNYVIRAIISYLLAFVALIVILCNISNLVYPESVALQLLVSHHS